MPLDCWTKERTNGSTYVTCKGKKDRKVVKKNGKKTRIVVVKKDPVLKKSAIKKTRIVVKKAPVVTLREQFRKALRAGDNHPGGFDEIARLGDKLDAESGDGTSDALIYENETEMYKMFDKEAEQRGRDTAIGRIGRHPFL